MRMPKQEEILKHYGVEKQTLIWMEELAELSKACSKCLRERSYLRIEDLTEEIADVLICIQQMKLAYGIEKSTIVNVMWDKYDRQMKRIERENGAVQYEGR